MKHPIRARDYETPPNPLPRYEPHDPSTHLRYPMLKKKMVDGKLWFVNGDKKVIEFPQSDKYTDAKNLRPTQFERNQKFQCIILRVFWAILMNRGISIACDSSSLWTKEVSLIRRLEALISKRTPLIMTLCKSNVFVSMSM
jgi:hypothetical protein